jgi:UDP-N-acetylglucosamine 2-epimerase (non-hydrolysing)
MEMRVLIVFGTGPEAIKMAPIIKELNAASGLARVVCATDQHRRVSDQIMEIFGIHPDIDLNIMTDDQDLYDVTSKILHGMHEVLSSQKPDLVLIQATTSTAFAMCLSACYPRIAVGHVEAGLKTGNM